MQTRYKIAIGVGGLLALVLHGLFIAYGIQRFRKEDRSISVKGLAEREVMADQAVWTIKTEATVNDLQEGSRRIEASKKQITDFLLENGVKKDEIIQLDLNVTDKEAQAYGNYVGNYRYLVQNSLQVRSSEVKKIQELSRRTDELLKMISSRPCFLRQPQTPGRLQKNSPKMEMFLSANSKVPVRGFSVSLIGMHLHREKVDTPLQPMIFIKRYGS